jgi:pyruvate,water dikinase
MSDSNTSGPVKPTEIPLPPDFPVTWENPQEAQLTWQRNPVHFPEPITPMTFTFAIHTGTDQPMELYELPIRFRARRINSYYYLAVAPVVAPEEMAAQGEIAGKNIETAMGRLGEMWSQEAVPELKSHLDDWKAYDLKKADSNELLDHFEVTITRMKRMYEVHHKFTFPWLVSQSMFEDVFRELFPDLDPLDTYKMLGGFPNKSVEIEHALWDLSRKILASATLREVFEKTVADKVMQKLETTDEGRSFLGEFRDYLEEYGQGICKFYEISSPSWFEDPTPVIEHIKDYMKNPDRDVRAEREAVVATREKAVSNARARLRGHSEGDVKRFEFLLKAAQEAAVISEDHNFWIDYCGLYQVRRVLLEIGKRLAQEGTIENDADVFYLEPDQLREAMRSPGKLDVKGIIASVKADMEHFRKIQPPVAMGTDYGPPPGDPVSKAFGRLFGGPPDNPEGSDIIRGSAGSSGKARGTARVILSLAEEDKLQDGDVLVAHTTLPPWTQLFARAAAVVTDVGGVLSHAGVVAREYGIPAVVSTGVGTMRIRDGQLVEVDGSAGTVRIIG